MISVINSSTESDRIRQMRGVAMECYLAVIRDMGRYAIDFEDSITRPYRHALENLAEEVTTGELKALTDSRSTLRALQRDFRDRAAKYLNALREELTSTARALEEIMESFGDIDSEHQERLRDALLRLRGVSGSQPVSEITPIVQSAANDIEYSLEQLRKEHQASIAQFQVEIQMLHQRIDLLESAAAIDCVTSLMSRPETEQKIRDLPAGSCLLLLRVSGIRAAEVQYKGGPAEDLITAFARRMRNSLPNVREFGRWTKEEFVAIAQMTKAEALTVAQKLAEYLSGAYVVLDNGKSMQLTLHVSVGVVDGSAKPDVLLSQVNAFLTGR